MPKSVSEPYLEDAYRLFRLYRKRGEHLEMTIQEGKRGPQAKDLRAVDPEAAVKMLTAAINTQSRKTQRSLLASKTGVGLRLAELGKKLKLSPDEETIIFLLLWHMIGRPGHQTGALRGSELLLLLGYRPPQFPAKCQVLFSTGRLRKNSLIEPPERREAGSVFETSFRLSSRAVRRILGGGTVTEALPPWLRENDGNGLLIARRPATTFADLVLDENIFGAIDRALHSATGARGLLKKWGLEERLEYGKTMSMLFYGPPGTGKTATAEAIAHRLKKKIGIVNFAQMFSMWVGGSEKNLVKTFETAKQQKCILVFDEAEALFGKRLAESNSSARWHNMLTNVLMQQVEWFNDIVILTTNCELAMDEAFERRILLKLKFNPPQAGQRALIWKSFITDKMPLADDVDLDALGQRFDLAGGHIKNVVLKAVYESAYTGQAIDMATLTRFADEEIRAAVKRRVGFEQ